MLLFSLASSRSLTASATTRRSRLGQTPTLATMLKSAGYRTGAFVGALVLNAAFGLDRDFDIYDDRFSQAERTARV